MNLSVKAGDILYNKRHRCLYLAIDIASITKEESCLLVRLSSVGKAEPPCLCSPSWSTISKEQFTEWRESKLFKRSCLDTPGIPSDEFSVIGNITVAFTQLAEEYVDALKSV